MGKTPETPNPKPEREMGRREKKPRNQRGKWEKEENGKRKRETDLSPFAKRRALKA